MPSFYEIHAKADAADHAEILIYDEIGKPSWFNPEAVAAKQFAKDLKALDVSTISLRINSPGGSVTEGQAIHNAISRHKATVTAYVDGLAGSIATVVALAADQVVMAKNALWMIHNPYGGVLGEASDMRKTADLLDKVRGTIIGIYQAKTGKPIDEIAAAMDEETWLNADEALEWGFADSTSDAEVDLAALAHFDATALARFHHVPGELAAALAKPAPIQAAAAAPTPSPDDNADGDARSGVDTIDLEAGAGNDEHLARVVDLLAM